ncbi:MAG: hypothetical protein ABI416_20095, partial [Ginsengibacter sp.]
MKKVFLFCILCSCTGVHAQTFDLQFRVTNIPAIFGPGIISDGLANRDIAISPSNNELFYTLQYGTQFNAILYCKKVENRWTKPVIAPFSGRYGDLEPAFSPDGKRLYFTSNRPISDTGKEAKDFDLWYVEKKEDKWDLPINMGPVINTAKDEFYASVTKNGNLYFTRDNDSSKDDIFFSAYIDGTYTNPVALGGEINSKGFDFNSYTDPDENYMIFSSFKRTDDIGGGDLYISAKKNGQWSPAINMGSKINSGALDYSPFVSFDKKYFFFSSRRLLVKF